MEVFNLSALTDPLSKYLNVVINFYDTPINMDFSFNDQWTQFKASIKYLYIFFYHLVKFQFKLMCKVKHNLNVIFFFLDINNLTLYETN